MFKASERSIHALIMYNHNTFYLQDQQLSKDGDQRNSFQVSGHYMLGILYLLINYLFIAICRYGSDG